MSKGTAGKQFPVDWKTQQLADVVSRVTRRNGVNSRNVLTISARDGLINQEEFFNKRIASADLSPYFLLQRGDFAYNKSYSIGYPVGVIRRLDRYPHGVVSPLYICFRPNAKVVDSDYLAHYFQSRLLDDDISWIAKEGARNHGLLNVGVSDLLSVPIRLPSLVEQKNISEILDSADEVIRSTEQLIAKLEQARQGIIRDLLTLGIGEDGELRDRGELREAAFGLQPEGWVTARLDQVTRVIDCKHYTPRYVRTGWPVVRPRNVKIEGVDFSDIERVSDSDFRLLTENALPRRGDIIFSRNASFGVAAYVDFDDSFAIGQDVVLIKASDADSQFIHLCLTSDYLQAQIQGQSGGSTFGRINLAEIRRLHVPVPPRDEQRRIVSALVSHQGLVRALRNELAKLRLLKRGLMDDLLTGRVRVGALA